jgi:hypothetical protein
MAWLFYSLDGAVISVLITNQNFNEVGLTSTLVMQFPVSDLRPDFPYQL